MAALQAFRDEVAVASLALKALQQRLEDGNLEGAPPLHPLVRAHCRRLGRVTGAVHDLEATLQALLPHLPLVGDDQ